MMTTATAQIHADIRYNRVQQGLLLWYVSFWLLLGIAPRDRQDWLLENFLVVLFAGLLINSGLMLKVNYSMGVANISNAPEASYKNSSLGATLVFFVKKAGQ